MLLIVIGNTRFVKSFEIQRLNMSGIIDPKFRVLDTIVTLEGRKQMVSGKFVVKYVSLTDGATFYSKDVVSGSSDASRRLFFECASLPQDQIVIEADDSGMLMPFANTTGFQVSNGKIFSGSSFGLTFLSGTEFASKADGIFESSLENFKNLYSIGTVDSIFEDDEFDISHSDIKFKITDSIPIPDQSSHSANVNHLESFFQDERLSNISNFKYLPPMNKVSDRNLDINDSSTKKQFSLGNYPPLGPTNPLTFDDILAKVESARQKGNVTTLKFDPTNNANKLFAQIFEVQKSALLKLDVIEFGTFKVDDQISPTRHVFFAGKVYEDDFGCHTFVHLFSLIFR